jgi:hypothetical protein
MVEDPVREYIVHRLADGVHANDIVLEICHREGIDWAHAETLVEETRLGAVGEVARRRFPLFAFLAAGVILGGVALIGVFAYGLLGALPRATPGAGPNGMAQAGGLIAWLLLNLEFVGEGIAGVAMVIGGAVGLHRVMKESLEM